MNQPIIKAPGIRRIGNKLLPIGNNDEFYPLEEQGMLFRTVDAAQTVIQGVFDDVTVPCTVIDNDANFTPDLVGKPIYRLNTTSGTDAGDCLYAPDTDNAQAIIVAVLNPTTLVLNIANFRKNVTSMRYAIDNHTGKVTEWLKGITSSSSASKLIDATANYDESLVGKYVLALPNDLGETPTRAKITAVDSGTQLSLDYNLITASNVPYMIIIEDDPYRYVGSPAIEIRISGKMRMQVIIKDGTYREGNYAFYNPGSGARMFIGDVFFMGDRNHTGVIISGAYANTPTTKGRNFFATGRSGDWIVWGIKFQYYSNSSSVLRAGQGSIMQAFQCSFYECGAVAEGGREGYINLSQCTFEAIANGIMGGFGGMLRLTGATVVNTVNTKIFWQYGFNCKVELSATLSGAGSTDIGYAFDYDIRYIGGVTNWTFSGTSAFRREGYFGTNNTAASATAGVATLPANPEGFIVIYVSGVQKKIPYYTA